METLTAICAIALFIQLFSIVFAIWRLEKPTATSPVPARKPPVSVLRPVCGLENNLESTLRSTFHLDWPTYEVIFCAASADDPAVAVIQRLIAENPNVPARLLIGDDRFSVNPKLNNLLKGWQAARHDWIVLSDSNVLAPPDYLQRLFARWSPSTGMVCSPPSGSAPDGFFAEVECAWLNSFQARWQLLADEVGLGFGQGKTMLIERRILDESGGFERLGDEVAEDAAATKIVRAAGLSVRLTREPFPQPLGRRAWAGVWKRQLRWARLRRASFPLFFLPELVTGGAVPLAAAALAVASGQWLLSTGLLYAGVWYGAELVLIRLYRWPLSITTPVALLVRDLALPVLWLAAWFGNGFVWRGNAMAVPSLRQRAATGEEPA